MATVCPHRPDNLGQLNGALTRCSEGEGHTTGSDENEDGPLNKLSDCLPSVCRLSADCLPSEGSKAETNGCLPTTHAQEGGHLAFHLIQTPLHLIF